MTKENKRKIIEVREAYDDLENYVLDQAWDVLDLAEVFALSRNFLTKLDAVYHMIDELTKEEEEMNE